MCSPSFLSAKPSTPDEGRLGGPTNIPPIRGPFFACLCVGTLVGDGLSLQAPRASPRDATRLGHRVEKQTKPHSHIPRTRLAIIAKTHGARHRTALEVGFANRVQYDRIRGARTSEISFLFKLLERVTDNHACCGAAERTNLEPSRLSSFLPNDCRPVCRSDGGCLFSTKRNVGAGGGTRTHTGRTPSDFKSDMSTIPSRPRDVTRGYPAVSGLPRANAGSVPLAREFFLPSLPLCVRDLGKEHLRNAEGVTRLKRGQRVADRVGP